MSDVKVVLEKFTMEKERFGKDKGKYECRMQLTVGEHRMDFKLSEEVGNQIVKQCGDVLYGNALEVADGIQNVFEAITGDKAVSYDDKDLLPFVDGAVL